MFIIAGCLSSNLQRLAVIHALINLSVFDIRAGIKCIQDASYGRPLPGKHKRAEYVLELWRHSFSLCIKSSTDQFLSVA